MTLAATVAGLAGRAGAPHLAAESHGFLSPTGVEITFLLVGLVTLGAAVITVTTRQLVHAALWLVVALGGLAVEYLLLTAEFIAWVQVLIYVGSVIVLILFGLMLTRAPIGRSPDADSGNRWFALAVAVAAAGTLVWVVVDAFRTTWIDLEGAPAGSTDVTGAALFQHWVLPFEALSVLLLAALVGAIVLSRKVKAAPTAAAARSGRTGRPGTGPQPTAAGKQDATSPSRAISPSPSPSRAADRSGATGRPAAAGRSAAPPPSDPSAPSEPSAAGPAGPPADDALPGDTEGDR
ncbi:NADH-quinone oxidoreductase subunit J family protein [Streptomyces sp. H28]|uniref:NADH-quinone oxidoreductase subunit J family protein n=1 Tax=Streptomyces sp. H28 TaxID=2775865 RepID=UPI001CE0894C|nr:NADH-quinone oxidoreductase subunit J [Streptomyces sp. H28]